MNPSPPADPLRVLVVGPVPPHLGGRDTGGVHTTLVDVTRHLPGDIEPSLLLTNPAPGREPPAELREVFREVRLPLPGNGPGGKLASLFRGPPRLRGGEVGACLAASARFGFSPLRFLHHTASLAAAIEELRPDVVHVHMIDHPTTYALLLSRPVPFVFTIHSLNVLRMGSPSLQARSERLVRWNLSRIRHAIAVSEYVATECRERFGFDRAVLVSNGVDTREYRPREEGARPADAPLRILFSGHLIPRKGVDRLVRAAATLRGEGIPLRVEVVGDGPERARLEDLSASLGTTDSVVFHGWWPRDVLRDRLRDYDGFVMPSRDEGLSIAMLEALASGLVVVAGRPPLGTYEALVDGVNGFYFDHDDPGQLADRLRRLAADPSLRTTLAANARRVMVEGFDVRDKAREVAEVLRRAWREEGSR